MQSRIDSFFAPYSFESASNQFRKNTRLKSALNLLKEKTQQAKESDQGLILSENDDDDDTPIPARNQSKKRQRTKTTKLMDDVLGVVAKTKRRSKKKTIIAPPVLSDDDETFWSLPLLYIQTRIYFISFVNTEKNKSLLTFSIK